MNYEKLYNLFIKKYQSQELNCDYEVHHIIPRHAGGSDSKENLVKVSFRQHRFLHKLRFKAYKSPGDQLAYRIMYGLEENKLFAIRSLAGSIGGKKNVLSGHIAELGKRFGGKTIPRQIMLEHLSSIRPLANTQVRQEKFKNLCKQNVESGHLDRIRLLVDKEKLKERARAAGKRSIENGQLTTMQQLAANIKNSAAEELSKKIIENAERNADFLQKRSAADRYTYYSPEGIEFPSSKAAAGYYGNICYKVITRWARDGKFGWSRKSNKE